MLVVPFASPGAGATFQPVTALTDGGYSLILFNADTGESGRATTLQGLGPDETLHALAVGTPVSTLYGFSERRAYALNDVTGEAVPVGPRFDDLELKSWLRLGQGLAIEPSSGMLRVIDGSHGYRVDIRRGTVDPDDGRAGTDGLYYAAGDPSVGLVPDVRLVAYDDTLDPAPLYGIDVALGTLVRVGDPGAALRSPEDRRVTTIGSLGLDEGAAAFATAFTALRDGTALLMDTGGDLPYFGRMYRVDLATGAATRQPSLDYYLPYAALANDFGIPPQPARELDVDGVVVRLGRSARRDVVAIRGTMSGYLADTEVVVDAQGVDQTFLLDARGRGRTGADTFRMIGRPRGGRTRFEIRLHDVRGELQDFPRPLYQTGPSPFEVDVFTGGEVRRARLELTYVDRGDRAIAR